MNYRLILHYNQNQFAFEEKWNREREWKLSRNAFKLKVSGKQWAREGMERGKEGEGRGTEANCSFCGSFDVITRWNQIESNGNAIYCHTTNVARCVWVMWHAWLVRASQTDSTCRRGEGSTTCITLACKLKKLGGRGNDRRQHEFSVIALFVHFEGFVLRLAT